MSTLPQGKRCFVLMPFRADLRHVHETVFKPVCAASGVQCWRVDELYGPGPITTDIVNGILEADVIIADITGRSANVFYELGIAHATSNKTILVGQSTEPLPFDVAVYRTLLYRDTPKGLRDFADKLTMALQAVLANASDATASPVQDLVARRHAPYVLEGGLSSVRRSFQGFDYSGFFDHASPFVAILNDGRTWVDSYRERIAARARAGYATTVILIHPRSAFIDTLIRKNQKRRASQVDELRRSFRILNALRALSLPVDVRGHHLFNPCSLFINERMAAVMPYFFTEAGELPVFTFESGGVLSLYHRYAEDVAVLLEMAEPLHEDDFPSSKGGRRA